MNKNDPRRNKWLAMRHEKKMSLQAIGDAHGVSREYVRQVIGNTGHARRPVGANLNAVHEFIKAYDKQHGYPPSIQDIAETFPNLTNGKPTSFSVVSKWLDKLEDMGKIKRTPFVSRSIVIL